MEQPVNNSRQMFSDKFPSSGWAEAKRFSLKLLNRNKDVSSILPPVLQVSNSCDDLAY